MPGLYVGANIVFALARVLSFGTDPGRLAMIPAAPAIGVGPG